MYCRPSTTFSTSPVSRSCLVTGLKLLAMKSTPIEKYQYLTHLRAANVHLFYRLMADNVKVCLNASFGRPVLTLAF